MIRRVIPRSRQTQLRRHINIAIAIHLTTLILDILERFFVALPGRAAIKINQSMHNTRPIKRMQAYQ